MAKYQQYHEYKDSGVEWLGEIPNSWQIGSLRWMIDIASGESLPSNCEKEYSKENQFPVVGGNGVMGFSNRVNTADAAIAVGRVGALCGNIHSIDYDSWITDNALKISKWNKFSKDFLVYLLKTANLNDLASKTAQPLITGEQVKSLKVVLLPIAEQKKIANFLDFESAQIDTLIEKQQTLIQLLKEKRQAVISHAVTKGLNPDAPMKDSGVEWLGEVPEHWEVKGIKRLSEIKRGASPRPIADQKYFDDEGEYAWTRIADVSRAGMYLDTTTQRLSDLGAALSVKLEAGELFLSIAGTVGKPCITISKACIHDGFVYFPTLKINNKFLFYIFEAGQAYLGLGKMGTQLNLNTETVGGIEIGLPPKKEIEAIIKYIEDETARFDHLIDKAEQAIQLMQERRTALISAAVTGKIDVRGWRAPE